MHAYSTIKTIGRLVGWPVYALHGREWVEKHTRRGGAFRFLLGPGQCTCLGWMRFGQCKHLQMAAGDAAWVPGEDGWSGEMVRDYIGTLEPLCPGAVERWTAAWTAGQRCYGEHTVKQVTLAVPEAMAGEYTFLIAARVERKRGLCIRFKKIGENSEIGVAASP